MEYFNPAPGYVLLKPVDNDHILITKSDPLMKGEVIKIGDPLIDESVGYTNFNYNKGDTVAHTTIGFETIELNGQEHRIISFKNILGKYEKSN